MVGVQSCRCSDCQTYVARILMWCFVGSIRRGTGMKAHALSPALPGVSRETCLCRHLSIKSGQPGKTVHQVGGAEGFLPNPSGLNQAFSLAALVSFYGDLRTASKRTRLESPIGAMSSYFLERNLWPANEGIANLKEARQVADLTNDARCAQLCQCVRSSEPQCQAKAAHRHRGQLHSAAGLSAMRP